MKDLEFKRSDGLTVRGRLFLPETGESGCYPLVVFAHGLGADWRELAHHGEGFAERGICAFLPDFCGGGSGSLSDGATTDMSVRTECADLKAVVEGLWALPYVDQNNTFLMGESLGGLVAALVAAEWKEKIRGLILWYAAFGMPSKVRKDFAGLQKEATTYFAMELGNVFYEDAKDIDAYTEAAVYDGPVLLIHGERDDVVPFHCSEKACSLYADAELFPIPGAGHGFDGEDSRMARMVSADFIGEKMKQA